jgi:hypothetical protein
MTSERHQMLAGLDSRNFAAPIRQILAGIAAHAIGAPIARVLTQPGPKADMTIYLPAYQVSGRVASLRQRSLRLFLPRHRQILDAAEHAPKWPGFAPPNWPVFISAVHDGADATRSRGRKGIRPRLRPGVFESRVLRAGKQLAGLEKMVDLLKGFYLAESGAL